MFGSSVANTSIVLPSDIAVDTEMTEREQKLKAEKLNYMEMVYITGLKLLSEAFQDVQTLADVIKYLFYYFSRYFEQKIQKTSIYKNIYIFSNNINGFTDQISVSLNKC